MENMSQVFTVMISAILINNYVLTKYLGLCTFIGVSKKVEPSIGLAAAVVFVMGCSSFICTALFKYVLQPLNLEFLKIIVFIIVIASFVQLTEIYAKKMNPGLYKTLGVYLILTATNCAVLAAPLFNVQQNYGVFMGTINGIASGLGFGLAIVVLSFIRERLQLSDVPEPMKGTPISFIATGLLALAFMGFGGLIKL